MNKKPKTYKKGSAFRSLQDELILGRLIHKDYMPSQSTLRVYIGKLRNAGWLIEKTELTQEVYFYRLVKSNGLIVSGKNYADSSNLG